MTERPSRALTGGRGAGATALLRAAARSGRSATLVSGATSSGGNASRVPSGTSPGDGATNGRTSAASARGAARSGGRIAPGAGERQRRLAAMITSTNAATAKAISGGGKRHRALGSTHAGADAVAGADGPWISDVRTGNSISKAGTAGSSTGKTEAGAPLRETRCRPRRPSTTSSRSTTASSWKTGTTTSARGGVTEGRGRGASRSASQLQHTSAERPLSAAHSAQGTRCGGQAAGGASGQAAGRESKSASAWGAAGTPSAVAPPCSGRRAELMTQHPFPATRFEVGR